MTTAIMKNFPALMGISAGTKGNLSEMRTNLSETESEKLQNFICGLEV